MIGLFKTYALQASLIALLATGAYAGVQTWRLGNAQDKIGEQRQLIVDVKAANIVNQTTIETLRKANAEWSAKCRARIDIWASHIEVLEKEKAELAEKLRAAPKVREVIYRESKDECAYIPVPDAIRERLK